MKPTIQKAMALREQSQSAQQNNINATIVFPKPETVKGRVLGAMLRGDELTVLDCLRRFGSDRLPHHVWSLKKHDCWSVTKNDRTVTTSDAGRKEVVTAYSLSPSVVSAAGEFGQRYAEETLRIERERRAA